MVAAHTAGANGVVTVVDAHDRRVHVQGRPHAEVPVHVHDHHLVATRVHELAEARQVRGCTELREEGASLRVPQHHGTLAGHLIEPKAATVAGPVEVRIP